MDFENPDFDEEHVQTDDGFSSVVEHMYKPREAVFGAVARDMVDMGWSIFPQEADSSRRPGTVGREMIKWSEDHQLSTRRPSPETLDIWCSHCSTLNVAVVLGPASGNTFVLDIDVVEEELSASIQEIAETMLGYTPLRRVGRWPKIALVYRHSSDDVISGRSPTFIPFESPENPDNTHQKLEVIGSGQAMTFYGKHHLTGRYFSWLDGPPTMHAPESVPLVSSKQLNDFFDAVDSIRQFQRSASFESTGLTYEYDPDAKIHIPRIRTSANAAEWIENEDGIIIDGRENYLTSLAFRVLMANPDLAKTDAGLENLIHIIVQQFENTAELSGRWQGQRLLSEVRTRAMRTAKKIRSGELVGRQPLRDDSGKYVISTSSKTYIPAHPKTRDVDSLDFLPPPVDPTKPDFKPYETGIRRPIRGEVIAPEPGSLQERAIEEDRTRIATSVQDSLQSAFNSFWDEVYDTDRRTNRIHILKAPTGAGKTSRGIAFIAEDPRTKEDYIIRGSDGEIVHQGRCPILILMPTYANIDELRNRTKALNLDGDLSDAELRAQASHMGLIQEDELPEKLAELRRDAKNAGLETMIYQGKLRANCQMAEKMKLAMEAGIGTSSLCKAEVPTAEKDDNGKRIMETKLCQFYENCDAISQKRKIEQSHVVFLPHAFLSLSIPEELKHVRAVVADERIHHLFLHTTTFPLSVFNQQRKPVVLRKHEKEAGIEDMSFEPQRHKAVKIVREALLKRECPAEALARHPEKITVTEAGVGPKAVLAAEEWIKAAIRICGASLTKDGDITPDIELEELKAICSQPTGEQVREEYRFWKIIQERYEARKTEILHTSLAEAEGRHFERKSKGDRDMRIQYVQDEHPSGEPISLVRISWRETPNWVDRPLLLLDASAAPEMISKIWSGKDVVNHDIPAALNVRTVCIADRTYSNSSLVASPNSSAKEKLDSAKLLSNVKKAISTVSSQYGFSRVVAGGSILARRAINTGWEGPHNVDWCHFGAMRGLDFAKHHAAAISVGRMELPVRTLDGLVAALTYDDDNPEQPFDTFGTGYGNDGLALRIPMGNQKVKMRSGHDVIMPVPMFPGKWGRMIQRQYREEELLQFLGRLRPVYREGDAPIWFSLSSVIPEEVIVDDIINIEDLINNSAPWEIMRTCQGILDVRLAVALCDDMVSTTARAAALMRRVGINDKTGEMDPRVQWGIIGYRWTSPEGKRCHSFVRAEIANPEEALRNALRQHLGFYPEDMVQITQPKGKTLARGREADTIEDELGTLEDRRSVEGAIKIETAIELLLTTPPEAIESLRRKTFDRQVPIRLPSGVEYEDPREGTKEGSVNINEAMTRLSIKRLWASLGREEAKFDITNEDLIQQIETQDQNSGEYTAIAAGTGDGKHEFDLMVFDAEDLEIPW